MHFLPSQHVLKLHFDWDKTHFHWKGLHATGLWKAEVQPHHSNKGATSAWIWLVLIFLLCNKDLCFELNLSWLQNKIELNIHIFLTSKETLGYFVNSSCHLPHKHFCRGEDFSLVFQVLQTPPAILFQIKTEMLCIFHHLLNKVQLSPTHLTYVQTLYGFPIKPVWVGLYNPRGRSTWNRRWGTVGNRIRAIIHSVNLGIPHFTLCKESIFTNP